MNMTLRDNIAKGRNVDFIDGPEGLDGEGGVGDVITCLMLLALVELVKIDDMGHIWHKNDPREAGVVFEQQVAQG
jgi:hypothetical protein